MARLVRRRLALAIALVAVLAGGAAVALGATHSHATQPRKHARRTYAARVDHRAALLASASAYLGVPAAQVRSELDAGRTLGQIAAATAGRSEAGLAAALLAAATERLHAAAAKLPARVQSLVTGGHRGPRSRPHHAQAALRAVAASYLGIPGKTLLSELRSGRTLAQVAAATPGRSVAGLRGAILAALKQRLDGKVAAGALARGNEAQRASHLQRRVSAMLNRSRPRRARAAHKPAG